VFPLDTFFLSNSHVVFGLLKISPRSFEGEPSDFFFDLAWKKLDDYASVPFLAFPAFATATVISFFTSTNLLLSAGPYAHVNFRPSLLSVPLLVTPMDSGDSPLTVPHSIFLSLPVPRANNFDLPVPHFLRLEWTVLSPRPWTSQVSTSPSRVFYLLLMARFPPRTNLPFPAES